MTLTAETVHKIFMDCLFADEEIKHLRPDQAPEGALIVTGLTIKAGFNPKKIEKYKQEILTLLDELPGPFKKNEGGGYSFLGACEDKHGHQWGEHNDMQKLFILGMAVGCAKPCLPKELWHILPGGVPYFVVNTNPDELKPWVEGPDGSPPTDEETKSFMESFGNKVSDSINDFPPDPEPSIH